MSNLLSLLTLLRFDDGVATPRPSHVRFPRKSDEGPMQGLEATVHAPVEGRHCLMFGMDTVWQIEAGQAKQTGLDVGSHVMRYR